MLVFSEACSYPAGPAEYVIFCEGEDVIIKLQRIEHSQINTHGDRGCALLDTRNGERGACGAFRHLSNTQIATQAGIKCFRLRRFCGARASNIFGNFAPVSCESADGIGGDESLLPGAVPTARQDGSTPMASFYEEAGGWDKTY